MIETRLPVLLLVTTLAALAISACGTAYSASDEDEPEPIETSIAILFPEKAEATARAAEGIQFGELIDTTRLMKDDCLRFASEPGQGQHIEQVQLTDCANRSSEYVVTELRPQPDASYPGATTLLKRIGGCGFGKRYALVPSREEWEIEGFRDMICLYPHPARYDENGNPRGG